MAVGGAKITTLDIESDCCYPRRMDETPTTLTVKDFLRVRSEVADRLKRVNTRSQTDFTKHAERLMELGYIDTAAVLSIFPVAEPLPVTSAEYPEESHDD